MKEKRIGRIISFMLVCFVTILFGGKSVSADGTDSASPRTLTSGEYQYEVLQDGTVSITKYTGTSSVVRIPEMIDGKKVTVIGKMAFQKNQNINTVYFSSSIREVMLSAFGFCNNLHYVYMNSGLKSLGNGCFEYCDLYTIKIPATVTYIDGFTFSGNVNLTYAEVLVETSDIASMMFRGCKKLEYIKIGKSIDEIGMYSLNSCESFKGFITEKIMQYESDFLVIPSQIAWLEESNFRNCGNWDKIIILNKDCKLESQCIPNNLIVYGYKNTKSEEYANNNGQKFMEFIQTKQIAINRSKLNLQLGETQTSKLAITYSPSNTTIKQVVWSSSNPKVATVDKFGNVTAKSNGTAVISARTFDESNLKQQCEVAVTTPVQSISLNTKELYLDLSNKKSEHIKVVLVPSDANCEAVIWKSSNPKVVAVSSNGKIKAKGVGTAKVTATVNGRSATCTVYVAPKRVKNFKVTNVRRDSLTLSWSKVKGASGYRIYTYSKKRKRYISMKDCSSKMRSYRVKKVDGKKLTNATTYKFKIVPYVKIGSKKVKGSSSYISVKVYFKNKN